MAILTVTIQLPVRAALWVHRLSIEQKVSVRKFLEGVVLRELHSTPGVDLSQSPGDISQRSNIHGGFCQTSKGGCSDGEEGNSGNGSK